jgi:signal transduction histidine kinase
MWPLVEALEGALGNSIDLRFGHVLGADSVTALRLAQAAEAACGQDCFGRMHAWLMAHPECHEGAEASEWADAAGLDVPRFRADLWEGAAASVQAHQVAARAIGVDQGPSLWLDGARYTGEPTFTSFLRACQMSGRTKDIASPEGALDRRDDWLALAAHEIRSPLAVLSALTGMMVSAKDSGVPPNDAHLLVVRRVVQRLCRLTEQMTTTAALRGEYACPPPSERTELGSLTRHVVEALAYEERQRPNVSVHSSMPVYGMWPTGWIEQVVSNLVGNALKFGGAGQVDVDVTGDATTATLVVRDEGPGVAVEDLPRLLRAYERGADSHGVPGLGLGLHVVHMLVAAMRGHITVDSSPGHGAAFRVTWPTNTSAAAGGAVIGALADAARENRCDTVDQISKTTAAPAEDRS